MRIAALWAIRRPRHEGQKPLRERHLRVLVREFERHYNLERFHQGLGGRLVRPSVTTANDNSVSEVVRCFEAQLRTASGSIKWCRALGKTIRRDGKAVVVYGTFQDITERKRAEQEMAVLSKFPGENPSPVMRIGRDGIIRYANSASSSLLGDWKCGLGQRIPDEPHRMLEAAISSAEPQALEIPVGERTFSLIFAPIAGAEYVNAYGLDVTERSRAEHALARLNRVLHSIRDVNQLITHEKNRGALLQKACDILTSTGGYSGAFIALTGLPPMAAVAKGTLPGELERSFQAACISGSVPDCVSKALSTPDVLTRTLDVGTCGECPLLGHYPGRQAMSMRLEHGGIVYGAIGAAIPQSIPITDEEHGLFREVAADLSYALHAIEQEEMRRESEMRFRDLFDNSLSGIALHKILVDVQGKPIDFIFLEVNPAYEAQTGTRVADILGRRATQVYPGIEKSGLIQIYGRVALGGEPVIFETFFEPLQRHYHISAFQVDQGRFAAVFDDVTERKRAEAALRETQGRYQSLFQASQDGIALADADTAIIRDCNPALLRMVGRNREEVVGQHHKILHPQQDGVVEESYRVHSDQIPELPVQTQLVTKTGSLVDVEITAGEVMIEGRRHLVVNFRDITERKKAQLEREKLEQQFRASQKMEAIGSLAGGVAHDFNNLISVILSYTGLVMEALREGDPLRNDLVQVKRAGERAAALTRQLLAFSRKQIMQPVSLCLNQVAVGVEKMLQRILGEDIDYVQALAPDLGVVRADPGQIEQVLMNLVVNARDAMPEGGKLTIETFNVEIDEEYAAHHVAVTPGSYVQLVVTDTGCGMDEHTRGRLFEPFFTTKEQGKGTGLGLSTVYGIVKQSGGNIWVYSEPGRGTTFKIYLPRELGATAMVPHAPVVTQATGTETILVVEDEQALREVARRSLAAAGFTVFTAANGVEALETAARHTGEIQLLLTDVVMPKMSGRALAQELVKTRPAIKVVYMSGYTDNAIVHHGVLDAGIQFIGKPFTGAELTRKVREVLDLDASRGGR
jgi:PAS domain S-box-containing protein